MSRSKKKQKKGLPHVGVPVSRADLERCWLELFACAALGMEPGAEGMEAAALAAKARAAECAAVMDRLAGGAR